MLGGCRTGDARFESTLGSVGFDPGGTVFSYLDARDDNFVEDADPRVAVFMSWIIFDPTSDLNDFEGSALADMSHELGLRDAFSLSFDHQGAVDPDATFTTTLNGTEDVGTGALHAGIHLAPERLSSDSTYADVVPLASSRTITVKITEASFPDADAELAGEVTITFEPVEGRDPGNALEGAFTGTFRAPLVPERNAEQNLALLNTAPLLGLPLPARPVAAADAP